MFKVKALYFVITVVIFMFLPKINEVSAETSWDLGIVDANHDFTITFSEDVDMNTVDNHIFILNNHIEELPIIISSENTNQVVIEAPIYGYEPGEKYYILISHYVKSTKGEALSNEVIATFTIREDSKPNELIEDGVDENNNDVIDEDFDIIDEEFDENNNDVTDDEIETPLIGIGKLIGVSDDKQNIYVEKSNGENVEVRLESNDNYEYILHNNRVEVSEGYFKYLLTIFDAASVKYDYSEGTPIYSIIPELFTGFIDGFNSETGNEITSVSLYIGQTDSTLEIPMSYNSIYIVKINNEDNYVSKDDFINTLTEPVINTSLVAYEQKNGEFIFTLLLVE